MNLRGDSMDIVNICTAGLMLSSAVLFAGNAVYDYKFGKKTTAAIRQFESGKPSSIIDDVLNQTLLVIAICTGIAFVFEELALQPLRRESPLREGWDERRVGNLKKFIVC